MRETGPVEFQLIFPSFDILLQYILIGSLCKPVLLNTLYIPLTFAIAKSELLTFARCATLFEKFDEL